MKPKTIYYSTGEVEEIQIFDRDPAVEVEGVIEFVNITKSESIFYHKSGDIKNACYYY